MFEPLLHRASAQSWIGYNGPGPTTLLFGNEDAGYFGEVTQAELLTPQAVLDQVPGLNRAAWNTSSTWLKFIYRGKVLFISKLPLFTGMTWNALYANGLVYGTDNDGVFPLKNPCNQLRIIAKDNWRFKARLIRNDLSDPSYLPTSGGADTTPRKSEYTELIYPVLARVIANYPNKWAAFTDAQVGMSSGYELLQETLASDTAYSYMRALTAFITRLKDNNTFVNRLVLELVDGDVFHIRNLRSIRVTPVFVPIGNVSTSVDESGSSVVPLNKAYQKLKTGQVNYNSTPRETVDNTSDVLPIIAKAMTATGIVNGNVSIVVS